MIFENKQQIDVTNPYRLCDILAHPRLRSNFLLEEHNSSFVFSHMRRLMRKTADIYYYLALFSFFFHE
mgnify:CR=1 FL=1